MISKTAVNGADVAIPKQSATSLPDMAVRAACDGERVFEGIVRAADLPRLAPMAVQGATDSALRFSIRFHRNAGRDLLANISVETEVEQTCARCLQPMTIPVAGTSVLQFVYNDEQAQHVMDDCEPVLMDGEGVVSLIGLLEDEVLMAVPAVSLHEYQCQPAWREVDESPVEPPAATGVQTEPERPNPFAELARTWRRSDES